MTNNKAPPPKSSKKTGQKGPRLIEEKGMEFFAEDGDLDETIVNLIEHYEWETFVRPPRDYCLELVLEFYKNLNQDSNESVVMGKKIQLLTRKY